MSYDPTHEDTPLPETRMAAIPGLPEPADPPTDNLYQAITSWKRSLRARVSILTVRSYVTAALALHKHLTAKGMPLTVTGIRREHIEDFLIDLRDRTSASTAANRHQCLVQFFKWLIAEDEIRVSPMTNVHPPKFNPKPVPIIPMEDWDKLMAACAGRDFASIRDKTVLQVLFDTGLRRTEIASLQLGDIHLDRQQMTVLGKGDKVRIVGFSLQLADQLDRYLRARARWSDEKRRRTRYIGSTALWLGEQGPLKEYGIEGIVKRRSGEAGLDPRTMHPHKFRHSATHYLLMSGLDPAAVQAQMGWETSEMLLRYGKSAAQERAQTHYDRHSPLAQAARKR